MKTEKIIVCSFDSAEQRVQPYLDDNWTVKQMIAQYVSSVSGYYSKGDVAIILEKTV